MLFQGQEFASSTPFLYFADHRGELGRQVRKGRAEFLAQFRSIATPRDARRRLPDPTTRDLRALQARPRRARAARRASTRLHRDLLRLRREDPVFRAQRPRAASTARCSAPEAFVLRFFGRRDGSDDRLLLVNLGRDLDLDPAPEPLLAPPAQTRLARRSGRARTRATAAAGTPPLETRTTGAFPATPPSCCEPMPAAEAYDPARGARRGDRGSRDAHGGADGAWGRPDRAGSQDRSPAPDEARDASGCSRASGW